MDVTLTGENTILLCCIASSSSSFVSKRGPKQHWITVCWYYRPEQTWHNPMQMFYEKEICKTGVMVEHPVEDIIERVGCQFYTKVG